mgnify:CR=1 FL=1
MKCYSTKRDPYRASAALVAKVKPTKAKLTEKQVLQIRKEYRDDPSIHPRVLSDRYDVAITTMTALLNGDSWKHVTLEGQLAEKGGAS